MPVSRQVLVRERRDGLALVTVQIGLLRSGFARKRGEPCCAIRTQVRVKGRSSRATRIGGQHSRRMGACTLLGQLFDNEVPDELPSREQIYR